MAQDDRFVHHTAIEHMKRNTPHQELVFYWVQLTILKDWFHMLLFLSFEDRIESSKNPDLLAGLAIICTRSRLCMPLRKSESHHLMT
jgi:hypothetical protein